MGKTNIDWATHSLNPIRARNRATRKVGWHCEHASEGCRYCYAEALNLRLGTGLPFKPGHRDDVEIFLDLQMLGQLTHWRTPGRVFVGSMTDLFADFVSDLWLHQIFLQLRIARWHHCILLTKRPERLLAFCSTQAPAPNIWLGFSAEDTETFYSRWKHMRPLAEAGWLTWCSMEPLLERVGIGGALHGVMQPRLGWIVVGGESGPQARGFDLDWARDVVDACSAAGVPCFVKQMGSKPSDSIRPLDAIRFQNRMGHDMAEWPEELRVRQYPRG